jgi:hypothetical protein
MWLGGARNVPPWETRNEDELWPIGHGVAVRQFNLRRNVELGHMATACRGGGEAAVRRRGGLKK